MTRFTIALRAALARRGIDACGVRFPGVSSEGES